MMIDAVLTSVPGVEAFLSVGDLQRLVEHLAQARITAAGLQREWTREDRELEDTVARALRQVTSAQAREQLLAQMTQDSQDMGTHDLTAGDLDA